MIEVKDQYALKIDIAGKEDFLAEADLQQLIVTEDAGNIVPAFKLVFVLNDETMLSKFNEGNPVSISFGATKDEMLTCKFAITKSVPIRMSANQFNMTILGTHAALSYPKTAHMEAYEGSAVEVMKIVASKYFKPIFAEDRSTDKQLWICANRSHQAFIETLWMHGDYRDSVAAIGITCTGEFICKNVKEAAKKIAAMPIETAQIFKFSTLKAKDLRWDVGYDKAVVSSSTAIANASTGYAKTQPNYSFANGLKTTNTPDTTNVLAMSKAQNRSSLVGFRAGNFRPVSENMHPKYYICEANNRYRLSALSAITVQLSFLDIFKPVKLLDIVYFKEESIENKKESQEANTGYYIVTRVTRAIEQRRMSTSIRMDRESTNLLRGKEL